MIKLCTNNVRQSAVGAEQGLDLDALFSAKKNTVAKAVHELFASRNEAGQWTKWLNLGDQPDNVKAIKDYAASVKDEFDDVVVLGIGGSSLGGLALLKALLHPYWNSLSREQRSGYPRFHFVDNVDPDCMASLLDVLDLKRTVINVISKSGTTAETMSAFLYLKGELDKQLGTDPIILQKHVVATTDPSTGILRPLVEELGLTSFEVPDDVGGRFSIFCAVGLLPAALCGVDIDELLRGIRELEPALSNTDLNENPAAQNALIQVSYYEQGKPISAFMPYSTRLAFVADWYVQLWAESLGKAHSKDGSVINVGPTPLKAVGATDQHSQIQLYNEGPFDKVVTFVNVETAQHDPLITDSLPQISKLSYLANQPFKKLLDSEFEATRASLTTNKRPNVTLTLPTIDAYHFGQLLYFLEVQTAIAGALMNIDPFDQPGVELAKQYTYALMGREGFDELREQLNRQLSGSEQTTCSV